MSKARQSPESLVTDVPVLPGFRLASLPKTRRRQPKGLGATEVLIIEEAGLPPREVNLRGGASYNVGRSSSCAIHIHADEYVSRIHGQITFNARSNEWLYFDLKSSNGSLLNGKLVKEGVALKPRDVVSLGIQRKTQLHVVGSGSGNRAPDEVPFTSAAWKDIEDGIEKAIRRSDPVVIIGPSGAGKASIARRIHQGRQLSAHLEGEFVPVNCERLPAESSWLKELFIGSSPLEVGGPAKKGVLELAENGTLYLEAIESMPERAQTFLIDLLDTRGDLEGLTRGTVSRLRIIYSCRRPLAKTGLKRELIERLMAGQQLLVPPLGERREDISAFVSLFARNFRIAHGKRVEMTLGADQLLRSYPWPGEVRELQSVMHQLLQDVVHRADAGAGNSPPVITEQDVRDQLNRRMMALGENDVDKAPHRSSPTSAFVRTADGRLEPVHLGEKKPARALSKQDIANALAATGNNVSRASALLGIARNTLKEKMKRFRILPVD